MSRTIQPQGWPRPSGYSDGVAASGETVFVGGQVGCDEGGNVVGEDLVSQARRALENIVTVVEAAGCRREHITRLTWYVTDIEAYRAQLEPLGVAYREVMGKHYPAMTLVQVVRLVEKSYLVEIEATAVREG